MAVSVSSRSLRPNRPARTVATSGQPSRADSSPIDHAFRLVHAVCCLAGAANIIDDIHVRLRRDGIPTAIRNHDTDAVFDWLMSAFSYQGISDGVALDYMRRHGRARWQAIGASLESDPDCAKLRSFWQFSECRYRKLGQTCGMPNHFEACPLPRFDFRNGRLNQTAYSLYLFIRDCADGDIVGWIDNQLRAADQPHDGDRLSRLRASLVEPLRGVYGVSDKVLTMALSDILLGAPRGFEHWREVGGAMIAIDTLVHNFLHRTGILRRFGAEHVYGAGCYNSDGCAVIVARVAEHIDARAFNPVFPSVFPRFVQHAIWQYCAQLEFNVCNGNRINDRKSCDNIYCQIVKYCDRIALKTKSKNKNTISKS